MVTIRVKTTLSPGAAEVGATDLAKARSASGMAHSQVVTSRDQELIVPMSTPASSVTDRLQIAFGSTPAK